jgi:hypothetical protein
MWRTRASVAALLLAAAPAGCGGGSDKAEDAAANDAILSELPTYPHAEVDDKSVNPYHREVGGGRVLGHTTNLNYEVPEGTEPRAVVRFYLSRVEPDWRCRADREVPIRLPSGRRSPRQAIWLLHCRRGQAILGVNTDNIRAMPPRYELAVDHNDRTE